MTPTPEYLIVGRVRKAHGVRGELVVEPITDTPEAVFAPGCRVFAGTHTGDVAPDRRELRVSGARPLNAGLLVTFDGIADRTAAELWRGRYLLLPAAEVPAPDASEIYVHELLGMEVVLGSGERLGSVCDTYELPQGLAIDVRREKGTVMIPFREPVVMSVDRTARVIVVDPPAGLLD
jgi:16S rRNA processing protein RimM